MSDHFSFTNIYSLLFQLAPQIRELSQKKNEINREITVCKADIAERRSFIEKMHTNIEKLEEEIRVKQSAVAQNKAIAKSMKVTNSLLHQYEQTLKEELESRKASYNLDMEVYEGRIANYRKTFQSHKEYYCQNPLAQKLLMLQAENEVTECRIKACDDKITIKQKELDQLTGPEVNSSTEKLPDSVSGQQLITEPVKQLDPHTLEDSDSSIDISSLHLSKNGHKTSVEANADVICEENEVQDSTSPEEASKELSSYQQLDQQDVIHTKKQDTGPEDQVLEQQSTLSDMEEAGEQEKMEETVAFEEVQVPSKEDNDGLTAFPQASSQGTVKSVPSTPTFPFNFGPSSPPHQGTSDTRSLAFLFSLNSDPSTPGFSRFGFDAGSAHDENPSFTFTSPIFKEKKNIESNSSGDTEFLFGQPEQSNDFQFAFKSPQTTNKDNTGDDFPFSFKF